MPTGASVHSRHSTRNSTPGRTRCRGGDVGMPPVVSRHRLVTHRLGLVDAEHDLRHGSPLLTEVASRSTVGLRRSRDPVKRKCARRIRIRRTTALEPVREVHTEVSYARAEVEELLPGVSSLVDAALRGDDPGRLMAAAGRELRTPLGLVSRSGYPLGWAPRDGDGQRALAVAEAAARSGLVAPPGWRIVPLSGGASALGFLAVGVGSRGPSTSWSRCSPSSSTAPSWSGPASPGSPAAWSASLRAGDRRRAPRGGRVRPAARRRVLGRGDDMAPHGAPAGCPGGDRARVGAGRGVAVPRGRGMVLLHPGTGASAWFERAGRCARRLAPSAGVQAIAADAPSNCPRSGPGWPNWRRSPGWGRAPRTNRC